VTIWKQIEGEAVIALMLSCRLLNAQHFAEDEA
jgi:hypothetical protein